MLFRRGSPLIEIFLWCLVVVRSTVGMTMMVITRDGREGGGGDALNFVSFRCCEVWRKERAIILLRYDARVSAAIAVDASADDEMTTTPLHKWPPQCAILLV